MSAILNLPDIRPSLLLDFANSGRVDPRIQFMRASTATCFGPDGKLRTVAANVPRIDYDPATGECRGLLVEEQRTNLLLYSGDRLNAAWDTANINGSGNNYWTVSPSTDVGTPVDVGVVHRYVANPTSVSLFARQFGLFTAGKSYVASIWVYVPVTPGVDRFNINANFSDIESANSLYTYEFGKWIRLIMAVPALAANRSFIDFELFVNTGAAPPSGLTFYATAFQLEEGSFPTSYIPTTDSQVTRAIETAAMTGTNFSDWYRQGEGTLLAESSIAAYNKNTVGEHNTVYVNDGTPQNRIGVRAFSDGVGNLSWDSTGYAGGVTQWDSANVVINTPNALVKNALTYIKDSVANSVNGSVPSVDTSAEIPNVTQISFGSVHSFATSTQHIRRIAYYPRRITNEQLQRLTAL